MASFISILSLLLLVLVNGYFTLPLNNEQFQTSTILSSNVDVTSERPFISRALLNNQDKNELLNPQIQQTTESLVELQTTTVVDNLSESATRESRAWTETSTLSPWMLTTDESKADKRGLNDLLLTTVESTTEDDHDSDTTVEGSTAMESQSELKNDKREVLPESTTNTLSLTSPSSAVTLEPSKKFAGSLKDREQDLEQEKGKDDEDKKPVKSSKTNKKEKEDDDDKEKSSKTEKKEKEDNKVQSDEDSKTKAAPAALLDTEGLKNVSNYPKEYMDLDENSTLTVTLSGSTDSTTTLKYKKGKKPLNQGEESSTAKEEESNN